MYVMKVCFRFFKLYFVNRKLKMWTKVVFFYLCEQQFLYLSHRQCLLASCGEVFFCQILASRFTCVQVVYLRWGDINWYERDRLIYFIFKWKQVSCCEHRFHTDEIKIEQMQDYFFLRESKVYAKFMYTSHVILKISHENCLDVHEIFRNMYEL